MAAQKTNVMRLLEQKKIAYTPHEYAHGDGPVDGATVARITGLDPACVFKTLVARGDRTGILVFCIPVSCTLDLKKAAAVSGNKKVEMILMKELLSLTGYIRGGCSPIGMKKQYPTFIDETAILFDEIAVSGGARGLQMVLSPEELISYAGIISADLTE